jgi:sigma-54 dependent transcriptional regulator, acetoin dehydrogenase operon transcriptional activator AcoR
MSPSINPDLVVARALRGRGSTLPPGVRPSDEILHSWARCLDQGLDFSSKLQLPVADAAELARRRDAAGTVRRLARAELETLMQQIAGSNFLLAFADPDGTVLDVLADNRFALSSAEDVVVGSCWREDMAGTNGLGTALQLGRAVAVSGPDHYFLRLSEISCTASPIRDADGHVVGLLDASSYVQSRQRHTQALVQMSTAHIENVLLAEQRAGHMLVALHPRREFLRTIGSGLLAFDGDGVLSALNARASVLLAGLDARRGSRFEQLFDERFTAFVARMAEHGETRLHDRLGSALVARWVGPRAARTSAAAIRPTGQAAATPPRFVAGDPAVAEALRVAEQALRQRVPLLVRGATGTGKERLLREAASACGMADALTVVNCASVAWRPGEATPAELLTEGQVVVLDEVGELSAPAQTALLGWLDVQAASRGGARLAATTQRDLALCVAQGRFRADLLYRLCGMGVDLPPLARREDFDACVRHALADVSPRAHADASAIERLRRQAWPGNWRELRSLLLRAWCALAPASGTAPVLIDAQRIDALVGLAPALPATPASVPQRETTALIVREWQRQGRSVSATARKLGISRNTVYRHLREFAPHGH